MHERAKTHSARIVTENLNDLEMAHVEWKNRHQDSIGKFYANV